MSITQRDVKLVYGGLAGDITATPQGSSLTAPIGSGVPFFQGVSNPQPDVFLDFADGTSLTTLGINISGSQTSQTLPFRKHSYDPIAGEGGTGAIVMDWFTGMNIQFSPVWVTMPGGFTPHYRFDVRIKQTQTMVHEGSAIKLFRQITNGNYQLGTLEWADDNLGNGSLQRWKIIYDFWATGSNNSASLCLWDTVAATDKFCGAPPENKIDNFLDGNFHTWGMECNFNDVEAPVMTFFYDGLLVRVQNLPPLSQSANGTGWFPNPGDVMNISPFCEMYSCGPSGCGANINTGQFIVSEFALTLLA